MSASLLDGKYVSALKRQDIALTIQNMVAQGERVPGLAVVLIGEDQASKIYVTNKRQACMEVGIESLSYDLPESTSETELLALIDALNVNPAIDGILIQLPLPKHINETIVIEHILPSKDVDGFHPYNLGRLAQRNPLLRPCTPLGVMQLLQHYQLEVRGKHAVVIGASNIVGRPMGLELLLAGATVTICHRFTQSIQKHVEMADIVVVAAGTQDVIDPSWLQKHQIVIDIGIHRLPNGRLRGDVDFEVAKNKVSWITPVPGGVGPMTIISLLQNTIEARLG